MPRGGQENRRAPRRSVLGRAVIKGPGLATDCLVRDLSATGARLQVDSSVQLPEEFNLLLMEANSSRHVILRWRAGEFAGVQFSQSDRAVPVTDGAAGHPREPASESKGTENTPPPEASTCPDKPIAPRRQVLGHCLIVAPGIRANAILRDISATGAKISVSSRLKLPSEFHVVDAKTNSARRVSLKWREGDFAGVHFCDQVLRKPAQDAGSKEGNIWHV